MKCNVGCRFLINALYYVKSFSFSLYLQFAENFPNKGVLDLQRMGVEFVKCVFPCDVIGFGIKYCTQNELGSVPSISTSWKKNQHFFFKCLNEGIHEIIRAQSFLCKSYLLTHLLCYSSIQVFYSPFSSSSMSFSSSSSFPSLPLLLPFLLLILLPLQVCMYS